MHQLVFDFLRQHCQNRDALIEFGRQVKQKHPHSQFNAVTLGAGLVNKTQLIEYLDVASGGIGVAIGNVLARIYDSLVYWDVLTEFSFPGNVQVDFQINFMAVQHYERLKVLENVVKGPNFVILRYLMATAAIVIEINNQESIGSGSIVGHNGLTFILTNRHVIDPDKGIAIQRVLLGGRQEIHIDASNLIFSESDDLAAIPLLVPEAHPRFFLGDSSYPLQEVILLGYPKIPLTLRPHMTAHSGEVNATIQTRLGGSLYLISNYASPGSSGGPLVDHRGLLIGVVSDSLEAQYEGENSLFQHSAAVPLDRVRLFIESKVVPTVSRGVIGSSESP
jgi:S1-C subfamily serine protease